MRHSMVPIAFLFATETQECVLTMFLILVLISKEMAVKWTVWSSEVYQTTLLSFVVIPEDFSEND